MEETHNYALNLLVPLMGIAPLFMVFVLKCQKKTNSSKSKLSGDFLFKKKDKKEASETEDRPEVVNKEAIA